MGQQGSMMGPMGQQGPMMGPMGQQGPMMGQRGPMMGPMGQQGPMMGPMGQQGPMMGQQGPMMGPMGHQGPMMGPQGPMPQNGKSMIPLRNMQNVMELEAKLEALRRELVQGFYMDLMAYKQISTQFKKRMAQKLSMI